VSNDYTNPNTNSKTLATLTLTLTLATLTLTLTLTTLTLTLTDPRGLVYKFLSAVPSRKTLMPASKLLLAHMLCTEICD